MESLMVQCLFVLLPKLPIRLPMTLPIKLLIILPIRVLTNGA